MSILKGGLPQGYSYMIGTADKPGPMQACLHAGAPVGYYLGHGPLQVDLSWRPDPSLQKFIPFQKALAYLKADQLLEWYTDETHSRLFKLGVQGLDEPSRIALATLRLIEEMADIRAYAGERSNPRGTITYGGPDYVTPAGMVSQVMACVQTFLQNGPLPEDRDGCPDLGKAANPETFLAEDKGRVTRGSDGLPSDDNSVPITRTIYFYRFDHSQVDSQGVVTSRDGFVSWGLAIMVRDTGMNWHFYKSGDGYSGFFVSDNSGHFVDTKTLGQFLDDEAEVIVDTAIIAVELVIDYFSGGASSMAFHALNKFLFAAVKAALTGETSGLFAGLTAAAGEILNNPSVQESVASAAKKTFAFVIGTADEKGTMVDGVGKTLGNLYSRASEAVVKANGIFDSVVDGHPVSALTKALAADITRESKGLSKILDVDALGHGMVQHAFDLASQAVNFPAITADFMQTLQTTLGGAGSMGDYWLTIGHDYLSLRADSIAQKVQHLTDPQQYVAQAKQEISKLVDEVAALHNVPSYAKNALYLGAIAATAGSVQQNKFIPDPVIKGYVQIVTKNEPGYVPPELKLALQKNQTLASKVSFGTLANLVTTSPKRAVTAANANVSADQVYPDFATAAVVTAGAGTLAWLGKDALAKAAGKPAWGNFIVGGVALAAAGVALALTRYTVHGAPLTSQASPPPPAAPNYIQAVGAFNASQAVGANWTQGQSASDAGKASNLPSTTSLIELSSPSHVFTVQEVQYLLNQWGSRPLPAVTGAWSDTTAQAVRDFQTREGRFGVQNLDGDPFSVGTSRALQGYAASLLLAGKGAQAGSVPLTDIQTLMGVPATGKLDLLTQSKLNQYGPLLFPPSPKGTNLSPSDPRVQTYFAAAAKNLRTQGV